MSRIGLVLGAGGLPGEAYHRGVLNALLDVTGWDARTADHVVGTSAGALIGAALRAPAMSARSVGQQLASTTADAATPWVGLRTFAAAMRRPWQARVGTLATSLLPPGRRPAHDITSGIAHRYGDTWAQRPLWIVAVRQHDCARVAFGSDDAPPTNMASAVAASCAIPGYFRPVTIEGHAYVDGGVHSPTNADLLAGAPLDLVIVSSPMSLAARSVRPRLDLAPRLMWHRYVTAEARTLRRHGIATLVLEPEAPVLRALSLNALNAQCVPDVEDAAYVSTRRQLQRPGPLRDAVRAMLRARLSA